MIVVWDCDPIAAAALTTDAPIDRTRFLNFIRFEKLTKYNVQEETN